MRKFQRIPIYSVDIQYICSRCVRGKWVDLHVLEATDYEDLRYTYPVLLEKSAAERLRQWMFEQCTINPTKWYPREK